MPPRASTRRQAAADAGAPLPPTHPESRLKPTSTPMRPRSLLTKTAPPPPPAQPHQKAAFVTVGTTVFDVLVAAVDDPALASALAARGFTHLAVQAGAGGRYEPHRLLGRGVTSGTVSVPAAAPAGRGKARSQQPSNTLFVEFFEYAPSLASRMASADLIISHAGAGSVFEALTARKALIAVPNPALMGDHQGELARALAAASHAHAATPATLAAVVAAADLRPEGRATWVGGSPAGIVAAIDGLAGRGGGGGKKRRKCV